MLVVQGCQKSLKTNWWNQSENKSLKISLERLKTKVKEKEEEIDEARELNGIYTAKLTKLQREFKKLKDEDEESYMEMTF